MFPGEVGDVVNAVAVSYPNGSAEAAVTAADLGVAVRGGSSGQTAVLGDFYQDRNLVLI